MIFVTVGTHEQPFNRLIRKMDELKQKHVFDDEGIYSSLGRQANNQSLPT